MSNGDETEKTGLKPILIYSQAQTGLNLCGTLIALHLLYFYTDRRGLSPALAGLAFFIALVLDALTDPVVGNISDRARFRSGRRRPFFLAAIPMALGYFLLFSPPAGLGHGLFAWFLGFYFLMLSSRKLYVTAYGALMPELTLDYDERTRLSTFRQLFGTGGDISGALLPFAATYLFARGTDFKATGAVCAIAVAGGALWLYLAVRERPEFALLERSGFIESLRAVGSNRPFLILLAATVLVSMAVNTTGVLVRFLAKYWYHDEGAAARWLMAYFAGSLVSYPFWFRITLRIEKKPAFMVAMLTNAACSLLVMAVRPGDVAAIYFLMWLAGFGAIGIWVTQMSAAADVIEWDEERTGRRQEGAYGGIMSMSTKIGVAVTMLAIGPLMTRVGYVPGASAMGAAAAHKLKVLFSLPAASIYIVSALVFSFYPITRDSHRRMRERLAARGAAAQAPLETNV